MLQVLDRLVEQLTSKSRDRQAELDAAHRLHEQASVPLPLPLPFRLLCSTVTPFSSCPFSYPHHCIHSYSLAMH